MRLPVRCISLTAGALVAGLMGGVAKADDAAQGGAPTIGADGHAVAIALSTASASSASNAPGATSTTSTTEVRRADAPGLEGRNMPGFRTDLSSVEVQHWVSRGAAGVGAGVGSVAVVNRPAGMMPGRFSDGGAAVSALSGVTMMFGLRYRTTQESSIYASATRLSGLGLASDDRVVSKVGVEFKAKQSNFKIDYGGLGMHFAGDTRMTLKLRRSGVAIGMRRSF